MIITIDLKPSYDDNNSMTLMPWIFIQGLGGAQNINGESLWYTTWHADNDIEELRQLQLAQLVFATVPLEEINSNNWAGILAERTGACVR